MEFTQSFNVYFLSNLRTDFHLFLLINKEQFASEKRFVKALHWLNHSGLFISVRLMHSTKLRHLPYDFFALKEFVLHIHTPLFKFVNITLIKGESRGYPYLKESLKIQYYKIVIKAKIIKLFD